MDSGWVGRALPVAIDGRLDRVQCAHAFTREPLPRNVAHIWVAQAPTGGLDPGWLFRLLDDDERQRALRFTTETLRSKYAFAHTVLRLVLAPYAGCRPAALRFRIDGHGKPSLVGAAGLSFSLSHTDDSVAIAVARDLELGIDIEAVSRVTERDELVERFFSPGEWSAYQALPPDQQELLFFHLWTRKEAFVKGLGLGLSYPLSAFTAGVRIPVTLIGEGTSSWSLRHLDPGPGIVGALALNGAGVDVRGARLCLDHVLSRAESGWR